MSQIQKVEQFEEQYKVKPSYVSKRGLFDVQISGWIRFGSPY
ncbi:hypothetical protein ACFQ0R_00910 [Psychroflexus salinarum]|uniref:Uncharacterized protein n=1 Tax=Psychroflexus salinarum TaxID=546024 RepID=A0ABW3GKK4_9FLAO